MKSKIKTTANDRRVAEALGKNRVCKASDLAYGSGRHIKRSNGETSFSTETSASCIWFKPDNYPKFVQKFLADNPRVQIICYSTNTRKLNAILDSLV